MINLEEKSYYEELVTAVAGKEGVRGIRNNNPLNLIRTKDGWLGLKERYPGDDSKFCQFVNIVYGIRAACVTLRAYFVKGIDTIRTIITRWCPDRTKTKYIETVSRLTGFDPSQILEWSKAAICLLVWAMAFVETGVKLPLGVIEEGFDLADSRPLVS